MGVACRDKLAVCDSMPNAFGMQGDSEGPRPMGAPLPPF